MTFRELLTWCENDLMGVGNLELYPIQTAMNQVYRDVYTRVLCDEAILSESFTWATSDGADKDVSGSLTRYRKQPFSVSDSSQTERWQRVPYIEILDRREESNSYSYEGRFVYATYGDYLCILAAPSSDLTVTVKHFQRPPDLSSMTDEPMLPEDFHDILVYGTMARIYAYIRSLGETRLERNQMGPDEARVTVEYEKRKKRLESAINDNRGEKIFIEPDPLASALMNSQRRRLRNR